MWLAVHVWGVRLLDEPNKRSPEGVSRIRFHEENNRNDGGDLDAGIHSG